MQKHRYIIAASIAILAFAGMAFGAEAQTPVLGDITQDLCVNDLDISYLKQELNKTLFNYDADVNSDNKVNAKDLAYVAKDYVSTCVPELLPIKPSGTLKLKMTHDDVTRYYQIYVPTQYKTNPTAYPLVMNYHGGNSDSTAQASLSLMNFDAQKNKYFAVYPDGVNGQWNDGREKVIEVTNNADDVGFTEHIINKLDEQLNINRAKMYATGISNGGMMSFRMACERPDIFAAIAPVSTAFTLELNTSCNPTMQTSVIYFQGTHDEEVLWAGGAIGCDFSPTICNNNWELGYTISVDATTNFWVNENGCNPNPTGTVLPNLETPNVTDVTQFIYPTCTNGTEVHFYKVDSGGHTWPGGIEFPPLGATSKDVKATETMWAFFSTKSR